MRVVLILSLTLLALAPAACALGDHPPAVPREEHREAKSSLRLIGEALERGEIDEDTATLYRVYSVFDESKIPAHFRGDAPMKDATPVLRDARGRFDALRPETKEALRPYLFPPGTR